MQSSVSVLRGPPALRQGIAVRPSAARPQARPLAPLRSVVANATYKARGAAPAGGGGGPPLVPPALRFCSLH